MLLVVLLTTSSTSSTHRVCSLILWRCNIVK